MNLLGIHLSIFVGPILPLPAPPLITESIKSVEVTHSDDQRSAFKMVFNVGRSGIFEIDYPLLKSPLLRPCSRIVLVTTFNVIPRVLMDGIITEQHLSPGKNPGESTLTVMGDDVSIMMDMEEKTGEHPAQDETVIANKLILGYPEYQIIPQVTPPPVIDPPIPVERTPVQQCSDYQMLKKMAKRYGYVFYVSPGPAPFFNTAYWGPPKRLDLPQKPLNFNMGVDSNVDDLSFNYDGMAATNVTGTVQDRQTNSVMPVQNILTTRPPLSAQPALVAQKCIKKKRFRAESGLSYIQAMASAQGTTDASIDVVGGRGQLDSLKYGGILQARSLVSLRGAGLSYDGIYYVKSVTHNISKGSYKQSFVIKREGLGSISPVVIT